MFMYSISFITNNFAIKTNVKNHNVRPFQGHFQVQVKIYKISINMFLTIKIVKNIMCGRMNAVK